ncbi:photoreceptor outer segment membrane glycoprotein 2-like [Parasteatoda tepidariorum]|uniref:photoreceptor outer segment membrane glycoprotein 2-like n=1 Tax=Parasteatoda tepidariorum TaxID=114398 RepID=UPI00077F9047|nr:photoreceptor outer segment membrane glycoprotein 2-like [Parasteatoda tepidariorum]
MSDTESEAEDSEVFDLEDSESALLFSNKRPSPAIVYIFSIYITDNLRQYFAFALLIGNFIVLNLGVTFMLLSWYVSHSLSGQIIFISGYYSAQAVPAMLILSGFSMIVASLLGLKSAIDGRHIDDQESAKSASLFFLIYWSAGLIIVGIIFLSAIVCFSQIRLLPDAISQGLRDGMEKYPKNPKVKISMDYLQMSYQCCGESGYKDWYNISWVDFKYLDISSDPNMPRMMKGLKYYGKDVPFSCCKKAITRPCVDTRIEDKRYNSKYRFPTDLTVNAIGCSEIVSKVLANMMKGVGIFVFLCIFIWLIMVIITRYLHTSTQQIQKGNTPVGYLFPFSKAKSEAVSSEEEGFDKDEENGFDSD